VAVRVYALLVRAVMVFLIVVALPMALGPASGTVMRLLAGEPDHHCMCGMKPGTCGCPECERLEQMRTHDREHPPKGPVVKAACDSEVGALPSFASPAVLPAAALEIRKTAALERAAPSFSPSVESLDPAPPPTPPPRIALALDS
jgi:hypothetical protein